MSQFKIGDRVKVIGKGSDMEENIKIGFTGKIIKIYEQVDYLGNDAGVEFDKFIDGHRCNMDGAKNGYCWNMPSMFLSLINKGDKKVKQEKAVYIIVKKSCNSVETSQLKTKTDLLNNYNTEDDRFVVDTETGNKYKIKVVKNLVKIKE